MNTFRGKFFKKVKLVQLLSTDFVLNLKSGVLFLFFFSPKPLFRVSFSFMAQPGLCTMVR